ncbi:hypothetical protein RHGRI_012285 [Rhododendron griersonianum]|uniref:Helicase C-terminal domain-containing protein n=1 Tax=Rhododendron griersonianum TaxID=479676 RepID=A0AAV6KQI1_9ERIC|nr:hypothetical protein RHGRI_012285 [Rhododendron griersonianum]
MGSKGGIPPEESTVSGFPFRSTVWLCKSPFVAVKWYSSLIMPPEFADRGAEFRLRGYVTITFEIETPTCAVLFPSRSLGTVSVSADFICPIEGMRATTFIEPFLVIEYTWNDIDEGKVCPFASKRIHELDGKIVWSRMIERNNFPLDERRGYGLHTRLTRYKSFKEGHKRILDATDLVGKGIDIEQVNIVFNYDMPDYADTYLHRLGSVYFFFQLCFLLKTRKNESCLCSLDQFYSSHTHLGFAAALTGRAPSDMIYIVDAVGSTIAWPADFVILDSSFPREDNVEVLGLKKCGVIESWARLFAIPYDTGSVQFKRLTPLCSAKDGEVMMEIDRNRFVVSRKKHIGLWADKEVLL